ncbi:MAG: Septum formation protein Maf [Proteobacteria bacterium]|nr:MAG: Septum formation protein Maf [Pseudomonadota bacterium]
MPQIILASSSPRRQTYFKDMGLSFEVVVPDIDETPYKGEKPADYVKRIAMQKALKVANAHSGKVVVAADTTVALGRRILGKPDTAKQAADMLRLMSGRRQCVLTAVCVVDACGSVHGIMTSTVVKIKPLSQRDIEWHVNTADNWQGKAGGYGIQTTAGGLLVKSVLGSHTGVVGLPLVETCNLLRRCGIAL